MRSCDICGKGTVFGHHTPHKGLPKKKGGAGQHIVKTIHRVFKPNLVKVHTIIEGTPITVKVCTRCLRSGAVERATKGSLARKALLPNK